MTVNASLFPDREHRGSIQYGFLPRFGFKIHFIANEMKDIEMNTRNIIAVAALSLLATVGAQAETYNGVHPLVSANSRADVQAQAVAAARTANPYATGANSGPAQVFVSNVDRAAVRAQAVAAAHSDNPYAEGYASGVASLSGSTVDRAAVRAEARAAARGNQLAL